MNTSNRSLRLQAHRLIYQRIYSFLISGNSLTRNELFYLDHDIIVRLQFSHDEKPHHFEMHMFSPNILELWHHGAQELIQHFFEKGTFELCPHGDIFDHIKRNEDEITEAPYVCFIINKKKEKYTYSNATLEICQRFGYVHNLLLLGPIFKKLRRVHYGISKGNHQQSTQVRSKEYIYIFARPNEYIVTIQDESTILNSSRYPSFYDYIQVLKKTIERQLKCEGSQTSRSFRDHSLTQDTILDISKSPPESFKEYIKESYEQKKIGATNETGNDAEMLTIYITLRFVRSKILEETELLSIAKTVLSMGPFLKFCYTQWKLELRKKVQNLIIDTARFCQTSKYVEPIN